MRPAVRAASRLVALALATLLGLGCGGEQRLVSPATPPPGESVSDHYGETPLGFFSDLVGATGVPASVRQYLPDTVVAKWRGDLHVRLTGHATTDDNTVLDVVCAELTAAVGGPVRVVRDTAGTANVVIDVLPAATREAYWNRYADSAGYVVVASIEIGNGYAGDDRRRVIRHMLMHALGFGNHSHLVRDAIMYDQASSYPAYLPVDLAAVDMLYRDEVKVGMPAATARAVLSTLPLRRP